MSSQEYYLILASQSPRRAELLSEAGFSFTILPAAEEAEACAADAACLDQGIENYVIALASAKAEDVFAQLTQLEGNSPQEAKITLNCDQALQGMFLEARQGRRPLAILAADTVAYCHNEVLGKPVDRSDAKRMLLKMSGRQHQVITAVSFLLWPTSLQQSHVLTTTMLMDQIDGHDLEQFLDTDGWRGKAGAFGYQDGLDWVHVVEGLASNVVGLPVELIDQWIRDLILKQRSNEITR